MRRNANETQLKLYLESLRIEDFRNIIRVETELSPNFNVVFGRNSQGKTNFAEAVYFTLTARSFRTGRPVEMIKKDSETARTNGMVANGDRKTRIDMVLDRAEKTILLDGKREERVSSLLDVAKVISVTFWDADIATGFPHPQRRFVDMGLSYLSRTYLADLQSYIAVVKRKNAFLKETQATGRKNPEMLDVWNSEIVDRGIRITMARRSYIGTIREKAERIYREIFTEEKFDVLYKPSFLIEDPGALLEKIRECGGREEKCGFSVFGPHRDEIELTVDGMNLQRYCSRGQQWSAVISLKLAQIETLRDAGINPIIILDDVFTEMDAQRRTNVVNSLCADSQYFINSLTSEDGELLKGARIFEMINGNLSARN